MRKCRICGQYKDDELFVKDKYVKGGIRNVCYECNKENARARRKKLSDVIVENKALKEKLEIAVQALEEVIKENEGCMDCTTSLPAEKALEKIKEIK